MKGIIILGAGWLGKPLAERFLSKDWHVEATSRSPDGNSFSRLLRLEQDGLNHTLTLQGAYWVCAIPPRASDPDSPYLALLKQAIALSAQMSAAGFLLCSSTGVYAEQDGQYDEGAMLAKPTSTRVSVLQNAEQIVLAHGGKVLRLAGLVGPEREPGRFVAGKTLSSSSQGKVNMVHQLDVIGAIETVIEHWAAAHSIYNVCYPDHPTRQRYYQAHCNALGKAPPLFARETEENRIVIGSAIEELGFHYQQPI